VSVKAGELRERIEIQTATITRNAFNEEEPTWATVATVWAKVVERGGREPVLADRPVMMISYEITIRAGVSVDHGQQVLWRGKTLHVETVTPVAAAGLLVLRCLEVTV
jgi:SPP1 family predicted phage head-tail adaptor